MGQSIANLLEFLTIACSEDMDVWSTSSTDEEAIRAIAREYPTHRRQVLLNELDALLEGSVSEAYLLAIAHDARVNYVLDDHNVREWFGMIRDQVRVVVAAA